MRLVIRGAGHPENTLILGHIDSEGDEAFRAVRACKRTSNGVFHRLNMLKRAYFLLANWAAVAR
jgi:hypothetical protein